MPYAAGQRLDAADLNLADARWTAALSQTINISAGGSGTAIPWASGSLEYNNGAGVTVSTSTLTLTKAGLWLIEFSVRYTSSGDAVTKIAYIQQVGGSVLAAQTEIHGATATPDLYVGITKRFTANTQLQCFAFSSAASAIDTAAGQNQRTAVGAVLLRP
jgi:hypothetical protein